MRYPARKGHHRCPGCRSADVPDARLACLPCWHKLPETVRADVWRTRNLPMIHPERREALQAAVDAWRMTR